VPVRRFDAATTPGGDKEPKMLDGNCRS